MASFKVYFSTSNIRRFRTTNIPSFEEFIETLSKHYPNSFHPELRVQYVDTEGDKIDVTTQLEWEEMFGQVSKTETIKIHITEISNPKYFKDGPPPQSLFFHEKANLQPVVPPNANAFSSSVAKCLEQFFPSGHILPFNIPTFLQNIVTIKYISGNGDAVVDIDVDIGQLGDAIHKRAMSLLTDKQYKDASFTFHAQGILQPQNPIPFYNVACAEALQGNLDSAILNLNASIEKGYRNLDHLLSDEDFAGIRHTDQFVIACSRLKDLIYEPKIDIPEPVNPEPSPTTPEPSPATPETVKQEPVPEPVKPEPAQPEPVKPVPAPEPVKQESVPSESEPVKIPQEEVTVPPQVPEVEVKLPESIIITPYYTELEVLHDIGYLNDSIIVPILEKNRGNVQQTVLELLDM